ncbi:hypothetical protein C8R43DRAFT_1046872 [Mycena crocata]|nr:hypothetical protein C8R43DRAFT_1046872 [Mycena crocata]
MSQTVSRSANKSPYSFLAGPPNQPLPVPPVNVLLPITTPTRRRSNSAIISWAARVQPGSPPPRSPHRRGSLARRPSIGHGPAAAGSFINLIDTPTTAGHRTTPSVKEFDLTNLGYSSVFVHLPPTPSPQPKSATNPYAHIPIPPIPASPPAKARRTLKHFRSLSALTRSRSKSISSAMPAPTAVPAEKAQFFAVSIAKRKKAQYKHVRPAPPLANELALMQFADGGRLEDHAARAMAHQAKAAGPGVGVGAVHRDEKGGLWWDAEEEWEYKHLLADAAHKDEGQWVQFGGENKENCGDELLDGLAGEERRGSVSTQDSDLDARYLVQPLDDERTMMNVPFRLLALPSRSRRAAKHLNKPEFVIDAAFGTAAPRALVQTAAAATPKGNARRRPAPLKLGRTVHGSTTVSSPAIRTADVRSDFLASSFAPSPASPSLPVSPLSPTSPAPPMRKRRLSAASAAPSSMKGKASMLKLFRRRD